MEDLWLTYAEAGQRLGVSAEAVRAKAIRKSWRRQSGNDGKTRVLLPVDGHTAVEQPVNARSPHVRKSIDPALVTALESHIKTLQGDIETLKEQLSAAEARAAADLASERARAEKLEVVSAAHDAEHADEIKAERARSEKQAADFAERNAQLVAALAAEQAKTEKAIAEFSALARRLAALAEAQRRPWWRRLAG